MDEQKPWIKTKMIIEVAGFPKEHIDAALNKVSENFGKETKKIKVNNTKVKESQQVKIGNIEKTKLFSGFVDLDFDVEDFSTLVGLMFDWMPSSVEIIEPEKITDNIQELNGVLNDLAGRLHQYDAAVKQLRAKTVLLTRELAKYKTPESKDSAAPETKEQKKEN